MNKIYFITGNQGKLIEAKKKFSEINVQLIQKNIGYPEIQTDTLKKVAEYGINYLKEKLDKPFILEDAGLFIESLNGFPGVYSAYVYYSLGCVGILKLMEAEENRKAIFRSVYAYHNKGKKEFFSGECKGVISEKSIGEKGFGYDPVFIPDGKNKTFAQMSPREKNEVSHRGRALDKLVDFFKKK